MNGGTHIHGPRGAGVSAAGLPLVLILAHLDSSKLIQAHLGTLVVHLRICESATPGVRFSSSRLCYRIRDAAAATPGSRTRGVAAQADNTSRLPRLHRSGQNGWSRTSRPRPRSRPRPSTKRDSSAALQAAIKVDDTDPLTCRVNKAMERRLEGVSRQLPSLWEQSQNQRQRYNKGGKIDGRLHL